MNILNYRHIIADRIRAAKYREALLKQIRPGDTVCDLGCGSGIMGFLALQAGAGHVHAIEIGKVIETAKVLATANGFVDRMSFYHAHARDVKLPSRVDWIIIEWMSPLGLDEYPLGDFLDARHRFLAPSGGCIPRKVDHLVAPVEDEPAWHHAADPWHEPYFNLKLDLVVSQALDRSFDLRIRPDALLGQPATWMTVDLLEGESFPPYGNFSGDRVTVMAERSGTCHGLAAWFDADLGGGIHLSNHPALPKTHWSNVFVPLPEPVPVEVGDKIAIEIAMIRFYGKEKISWATEIKRRGKLVEAFSNKGDDLPVEAWEYIAHRTGRFVPTLGPELQRLRTVLNCVDGKVDTREIARRLVIERPDLFPTFETAVRWIGDNWGQYLARY